MNKTPIERKMTEKPAGKKRTPIPVRFDPPEEEALNGYEKMGLNKSDLIRRCVKKSLRDVVFELAQEISSPGVDAASRTENTTVSVEVENARRQAQQPAPGKRRQ